MSKLTDEQKKQNRVYIVTSFGGQYEDRWEHNIGVYSNYDKALSVAKETCEEYFVDESKLPMTFDEYYQFNYGYPDCDEEYDYNDKEKFDYYNTVIDRDGHTVEEFEMMDRAQQMQYEDFTGCHIESYILDHDGDDKEKVRIFVTKCDDGTWLIN